MKITFNAFWLQKAGNQPDEYEDAYAASQLDDGSSQEFICAVADGATETSFSGSWAKILVDAFVEKPFFDIGQPIIQPLSERWHSQIVEQTREKPLSWYAEEKLSRGAFSALMGLHIMPNEKWVAFCVGDSCLFRLRPKEKPRIFPYTDPSEFNNHPSLISTDIKRNIHLKSGFTHGRWKEGDCFLLMTDALAHYFMSNKGVRPKIASSLLNPVTFEQIIEDARQTRACRNDDVTLLKVCIKPGVDSSDMA